MVGWWCDLPRPKIEGKGYLGELARPKRNARPFRHCSPASGRTLNRVTNEQPDDPALSFPKDGAERSAGAVAVALPDIRKALAHLPPDQAGLRIAGIEALRPFLASDGPIGSVAAATLGPRSRAVRAILFDKTAAMNWSLGWHQDRTISVVERLEVDGFGPWTVKKGMPHVAPPCELLSGMVTLRVHLDDVPSTNAPLLIAPGSHLLGYVPIGEVDSVVNRCGIRACTALAGDIWRYATPILHASEAASRPVRRRVLQVDYAAQELPGGLRWLGV
jgi:hypothetical protein